MKTTFVFLFGVFAVMSLNAQNSLQSKYNMLRAGDEIIKQQVEYKDPGRSGENVLWDFSKLTSINDEYALFYSTDNDTVITGMEHLTRYNYTLQNDSLLLWGFENQSTRLINRRPELLLKFPVSYAGQCESYFSAHGKHGNRLELEAMGFTGTKADAYGMMVLPNKDTLKNVLRTRTIKYIAENSQPISQSYFQKLINPEFVPDDTIISRLQSDSVIFVVETFRWYEKGYRYPVFETVRSWQQRLNSENDYEFLHTAFFYPPQEHFYLYDDDDNLALLDSMKIDDLKPKNPDYWEGLTYNFYPNPVETNLEVEIYLPRYAKQIKMQLTDKIGRPVWKEHYKYWEQGVNTVQIYMAPFAKGEYVLTMWFDGCPFGEKILKK
ncbi:MAG: hypothetical protein LBI82_07580 [Dysgonamonadaceae bacterium]|jgi:hypothetical protein|nr:hypothetical protein [Dysgonamonadaceae bacterium]